MPWYFAEGGTQQGPVTDGDFDAMVQSGRIKPDTLVWQDGMTDWKPWSQVKTGAPVVPPIPGGVVCVECKKSFSPNEVISYEGKSVCAGCKETFFQKVREGAPLGTVSAGMPDLETVAQRDYDLGIRDCLNRSWQLLKAHTGPLVGGTSLVYLVIIGGGMIPYLGSLVQLVLTGPLMGGLYLFYLAFMRQGDSEIRVAFSGFGPRFVPLMLSSIVPGIISGLCIVPAVVIAIIYFAAEFTGGHVDPSSISMASPMMVAMIVLGALGFLGMIYLSIGWWFAIPLVADREMEFWPAMKLSMKVVNKHWFAFLGLSILSGLACMSGVILCIIGVIFTLPIAFGAFVYAYEDLFCKA